VNYFFQAKFFSSEVSSVDDHLQIGMESIKIALDYPLGVGFNNFSNTYHRYYGMGSFNTHNSWLTFLVETGFTGLIYRAVATLVVVSLAAKKWDDASKYFLASYTGIVIASLGYETFDLFFNSLYIVTFFCYVTIRGSRDQVANQDK
jgi:hypothetical protein